MRLAGLVNAPGNDVFDTHSIDAEVALRDAAHAEFERDMASARQELLLNVAADQAAPLVAWLDRSSMAMQAMIAESNKLFEHLRRAETDLAAARMAGMDRHYAQFAAAVAALNKQIGDIQANEFNDQVAAIRQLEKLELLIGSLLVLMVSSVTFFGYKIVRKLYANEEKLARYSTSLAEARDAADASNKAKSDFLAVMSHEIRTPLTTVLGTSDLLAAEELPERARHHVHAIQASGRHLLAIVNDVLDLSRIEAIGVTLEEVDFSIVGVLEQVHWLMAPAAAERGIELQLNGDLDALPVVRGDPTRLRQVLLNLVSNAVKFTPRGHVQIDVAFHQSGRLGLHLHVDVRDTGIGIAKDNQERLFVAFSQAGETTGYGGTGLGLAICRRLIEAMGGTIGMESEQGRGSRFWFDIPFELGDRQVVEEEVIFGPVAQSNLRILVAEDVETNRHLLAEVLTRHGHEVVGAANGTEALDLAQNGHFDVILMDVQMPIMDGIEATCRLRGLSSPVSMIPVIGLTATVIEQEKQRCLLAGMNRCLSKPFAWAELFAAIAQVTASSHSYRMGAEANDRTSDLPLFKRPDVDISADHHTRGLLQQVIEEAQHACERLRDVPLDSDELLQELHKLKGAAGMFGLKKIRTAADRVYELARAHEDTARMIEELSIVVAETRAELWPLRGAQGPEGADHEEDSGDAGQLTPSISTGDQIMTKSSRTDLSKCSQSLHHRGHGDVGKSADGQGLAAFPSRRS